MDLGSTHSPSLSLLFSFFLLLTQNILYNTILYYILSYSQSKIFLLLTQNIYYYIIYSPLPVKNFSSADAEYIILYYIPPFPVKNFSSADAEYILLYILYPSPVKKINFSAVAAILRQFSPKLPQTPPFSPNLRHKKKFFWRLTPPKSRQNPTKSENEKKWPDASVYYILYYYSLLLSSLIIYIYIYIYILIREERRRE